MKPTCRLHLLLCTALLLLAGCSETDIPEVCDDGDDNDLDSYIDCDDQDCWLEADCAGSDDDDTSDDDDSAGDDDDSAGDDDDTGGDDDSAAGDDDDTPACIDEDGDNWCAGDDCDDQDPQTNPVAVELCDGQDNDCNGFTDENAADSPTWHLDADNDGYGAPHLSVESCAAPAGYVDNSLDCDDLAAETYPGAAEVCDGADNNCDAAVDEGVLTTWYTDTDGDGYGEPSSSQEACLQPAGTSVNGNDCDDTQAAVSPSAAELCDGIDNDCDQQTDEAGAVGTSLWYSDGDGDGFGAGAAAIACSASPGQVGNDDDCDDTAAAVSPSATEVCDGVDNNCDTVVDEGVQSTWYADLDGDGAGGTLVTLLACTQPAGYVALAQATDCDDLDATSLPGGTEVCDGADNNCDTVVDEGVTTTFFLDGDGDGFGDPGTSQQACFAPAGYSLNSSDCDDGQAAAYPGGLELCDGIDNDCNNSIDDDALDAGTWYPDGDGDSFGAAGGGVVACAQPGGTVSNNLDCNDDPSTGANNFPGNAEVCDGNDNNCNVIADESFDVDGDGVTVCGPDGITPTADDDCDDSDGDNFPGNPETCDDSDNDCDGAVDEGQLGSNQACAGASCLAILTETGGTAGDGNYFIDPDGLAGGESAVSLPCDMSGGGWTEIEETTNFPYQTYTESDSTELYAYVVSDSFLAALKAISSEASQAWACHTINVDQASVVSNWVVFENGTSNQFSACLSPGNNDERSASGTVTDFNQLPAREWHPQDCGDSNESCQHNFDNLFLR